MGGSNGAYKYGSIIGAAQNGSTGKAQCGSIGTDQCVFYLQSYIIMYTKIH